MAAPDARAAKLPAPAALRHVLGHFATGVTIVTCVDVGGTPVGLTVNSFNALSLDPPLILWSLRRSSPSLPFFQSASHFVVNILSESQVALSRRFASPVADKFTGLPWHAGHGGAPVLDGVAAVLECECTVRQDAGDHVLFIGQVVRLVGRAGPPLLYHAGRYHRLGAAL